MDSAKSIVKELLICVNEHDVKHINELLLRYRLCICSRRMYKRRLCN